MGKRLKVFVIDDQKEDRDFFCEVLSGFKVASSDNGECPLHHLRQFAPDIILLDHKMPRKTGVEILKEIRAEKDLCSVPVIMLSGVAGPENRIQALNEGADDYVVKPFLPDELVARIQAVLRRSRTLASQDLEFRPEDYLLMLEGRRVHLTLSEHRILTALLESKGRVVSREKLRNEILSGISDRTLDVHMTSLRKKLGDFSEGIETVRSVGYRYLVSRDAPAKALDQKK